MPQREILSAKCVFMGHHVPQTGAWKLPPGVFCLWVVVSIQLQMRSKFARYSSSLRWVIPPMAISRNVWHCYIITIARTPVVFNKGFWFAAADCFFLLMAEFFPNIQLRWKQSSIHLLWKKKGSHIRHTLQMEHCWRVLTAFFCLKKAQFSVYQ